jgi:Ca-activated chloride channel homolog
VERLPKPVLNASNTGGKAGLRSSSNKIRKSLPSEAFYLTNKVGNLRHTGEEIMKVSKLRILLLSVSILLLTAASVAAQGVIVPGPCNRCPERPRPISLPRSLPIKSIKIDTKILSQVATTHVEQIFRNDTDATLEGTYFFPIPEQASITEFAIWDGDRRLVGEVRSREEARRIYDEIVRRQRDPGLLEYAGKNLFQASIFPIPPHSDKKLELTYSQVLRAESGTVAYRYPLGTGRQVTQIGSVSGRIELDSKDPVRNIYSPTHALDIKRNGERRSVITFESQGKEPQDFQLFYALSREDFGVTLLTHREPGKDGYYLLMISPKDDWTEQEYVAKDIVFVLDTSGSMAEEGKMEKARAALLYGIRILRPQDRFNVISFAGEERLMETGLITADDQGRRRGETFARALRPVGGTNINQALITAMPQFRASDRPRIIVFMTDGLPTVGETNANRIIDNVHAARLPGVRLFTFGVGYDVNTALLDKLAADNGGVADYVEPKEDLEVKVSNFFAKINAPVLTDLQLDMAGIETDLTYPRAMPDLFRGSQVILIGRYRNQTEMDVRVLLSGKAGTTPKSFFYNNLRFPVREDANDFLPRLWATRRVGWLMEQIRTNGEQQELRDEVVDLGTRYGIVTPYTSYLAVEPNAPAQNVTRTGQTFGGLGGLRRNAPPPSPAPTAADAKAVSGMIAVQQSKRAREQQEAERVEKDASSTIRTVGGKTFYLREGVWTDSEFKAGATMPETVIKFGSDEYFTLLKQKPRLAEFFSLGERVVVIFEGRIYRVNAAN